MLRTWLVLIFVLAITGAQAGRRNKILLRFATEELDRALENKDTSYLRRILSTALQYGHSNGWIESKEGLIADLYNGKLTYKTITLCGVQPSVVIDGNTGLVREEVTVDILYNGKPLNMKLSVLQVWKYKHHGWILIGRQSTKI